MTTPITAAGFVGTNSVGVVPFPLKRFKDHLPAGEHEQTGADPMVEAADHIDDRPTGGPADDGQPR